VLELGDRQQEREVVVAVDDLAANRNLDPIRHRTNRPR
jgi:hypothetical protein